MEMHRTGASVFPLPARSGDDASDISKGHVNMMCDID